MKNANAVLYLDNLKDDLKVLEHNLQQALDLEVELKDLVDIFTYQLD